jgi:hypothetical protein
MSKTTFLTKCDILGDLWLFYREDIKGNEAWEEFFQYNDVALPLAYMVKEEYAFINEDSDGTSYINETWETFCDYLGIDPDIEYGDIREAFDASPNKPLEKE